MGLNNAALQPSTSNATKAPVIPLLLPMSPFKHLLPIVLFVSLAASPTQNESADPIELKVAFYSTRDGNDEIYSMSISGENLTRLTHNQADEYCPDWSPDGRQIAFVSTRDGNGEIYVMNADGSNQRRLTSTDQDETHPAWSPDGEFIVFRSNRDGNPEIYIMKADGSEQRRLTWHDADDMRPGFSPDGKRISFNSDRDGNWEIYMMDAESYQISRVTETDTDEVFPTWSPDSSQLVYFDFDRATNKAVVELFDLENGTKTRLEAPGRVNENGVWSSQDNQIVFQSNRDGNYEIYVMNSDGSNQRRLTNTSASEYWPSVWP